eukprot:TRINITY_DN3296_c0_g1_i1.p1 TRINITY_DN3296_c0_g1~~TRINITY_DN3296_c0_g1_i1.p1  ORF type:complete len:411 (-),score=83.51 TRINITY_DN3296_c0_g1_i1:257-1489(-)
MTASVENPQLWLGGPLPDMMQSADAGVAMNKGSGKIGKAANKMNTWFQGPASAVGHGRQGSPVWDSTISTTMWQCAVDAPYIPENPGQRMPWTGGYNQALQGMPVLAQDAFKLPPGLNLAQAALHSFHAVQPAPAVPVVEAQPQPVVGPCANNGDAPMKVMLTSSFTGDDESKRQRAANGNQAAQQGQGAAQGDDQSANQTAEMAFEAEQRLLRYSGGDAGMQPTSRWHESAAVVGVISSDGHVFSKQAGPRQSRVSAQGEKYELSTICMVYDSTLRSGGVHRYEFHVLGGQLGPADGAGFTFDSKVRRKPIQKMNAIFLNKQGVICLRQRQHVSKLPVRLPPLMVGSILTMFMDLNTLKVRFVLTNNNVNSGSADVNLNGLLSEAADGTTFRSGFFCAVVTGCVSVGLY